VEGEAWIEMMDLRNELSHGYDEELSRRAEKTVRSMCFKLLTSLYDFLKQSL